MQTVSWVTKMLRVPSSKERAAGLQCTTGQSEPSMQRHGEKNDSSLPNANGLEPAEYVTDRLFWGSAVRKTRQSTKSDGLDVAQKTVLMSPSRNCLLIFYGATERPDGATV